MSTKTKSNVVTMSSSATDPDYLAIVARGLAKQEDTRRAPDAADQRRARVLDSVAHILVSHARQVVAVGALLNEPGSEGGVVLLVAENNTLQTTTTHLQAVLDRLRDIRAQEPDPAASLFIPSYIDDNSPLPLKDRLVELETFILAYSWPRLSNRFFKGSRADNFVNTAEDVCGPPADNRLDLSEEARRYLRVLQAYSEPIKDVEVYMVAVKELSKLMAASTLEEEEEKSSRVAAAAKASRRYLYAIRGFLGVLDKNTIFHTAWDSYTLARIKKEKATADSTAASFENTHAEDNKAADLDVRKPPNVHRWISKFTSLCKHFRCLVISARSNTLGPMLLNAQIRRVGTGGNGPRQFTINHGNLQDILVAAGYNMLATSDDAVRDLLVHLAGLYQTLISPQGDLAVSQPLFRHCECLVLTAGIHGRQAVPYVGVSKSCCAFCQLYFAAYREVIGVMIYTRRGTHSQTSPWLFPSLDDPSADRLKAQFVEKLLARIKEGWYEFRTPSANASQSTDLSAEDDNDERALVDMGILMP
ncbi:hypothetical protein B0H17DRAFT_1001319 [Mycena rosella]|uniref:Uncharacterized protein n=1 Tax=Mycena rosella TaxID=1033263 RepID=A0AAD7GWM1_MYCRO|nr:hypothetical protein B0H17DRAFT_1001319 [Mycena rosella]